MVNKIFNYALSILKKRSSVVDSRPTEDGTAIRRRLCGCERKERFTTFEEVQFQELTVIKEMEKESHLIEIKFQNL